MLQAIRDTRFGTIEVTVHQSRIVQITRSEKLRFERADLTLAARPGPFPDFHAVHRIRARGRTADRTTGGVSVPRTRKIMSLPSPADCATPLLLALAGRQPGDGRRDRHRRRSRPSPAGPRATPRRRPAARAADAAAIDPADLDQRLRVIERKLELQAEEATAKAAKHADGDARRSKGLSVKSPAADGVEVKFKALVQADGRFYFGDDQDPQNDSFLFRRVEPDPRRQLGPAARLPPHTRSSPATAPPINDAYVDLRSIRARPLRVGKFKAPVGLERLQSSGARADRTRLSHRTGARTATIGVQLQGELRDGALSYAVGVFNGAPDGRDGATTNPDNDFEYAARVFFEPWKNDANALSGLGFGIAASIGDKHGSGNNFLPRYRTPGQVQFFNYRSNVAGRRPASPLVAAGLLLPQRVRPAGRIHHLRPGRAGASGASGVARHLENDAWQLTASYVLTGEDAGYQGVAGLTIPLRSAVQAGARWNWWRATASWRSTTTPSRCSPIPPAAAPRASAWGLGLNWYLTGNLKLVANYTQTTFEGGAADGADREDEKTFFTRAQFSF